SSFPPVRTHDDVLTVVLAAVRLSSISFLSCSHAAATTQLYTLSLHDALPISVPTHRQPAVERFAPSPLPATERLVDEILTLPISDRKSTRLNSSHQIISYAVFCLKKKKNTSFYTKSNPINAQRLLARTPTTN